MLGQSASQSESHEKQLIVRGGMSHINRLRSVANSIFPKKEVADSTPHYQPGTFVTSEEVAVYKALSRVFDANTNVFTKVWLAELVATPKPEPQHLRHWRRVQRRRLDFLICSASNFKPILAIKLETESDSKKRRKSGPGIVEEVLEDIGVPLLRLKAQGEYQAEDLAKQINFTLEECRLKRSVIDEPPNQEATTAIVNDVLSAAVRSTATLTNAVSRFHQCFVQVYRAACAQIELTLEAKDCQKR